MWYKLDSPQPSAAPSAYLSSFVSFLEFCELKSCTDNYTKRFDNARAHSNSILQCDIVVGDALEEWLSSPPIPLCADPILYWTGMQAAGHPLAAMALDYLSVPGMHIFWSLKRAHFDVMPLARSTDVEREFLRGGLTVSKLCHLLSNKSTWCATVLGSWVQAGVVPKELIIARFAEKHHCLKKKGKAVDTGGVEEEAICID